MTADELLADVRARPDSDEPRLVYADWLSERGDPRGELIELQCRGRGEARVRQILDAHERAWFPWTAHAKVVWARGFIAKIDLESDLPRNHADLDVHLPGTALGRWLRTWAADGGPPPEIRYGLKPLILDTQCRRVLLVIDSVCTTSHTPQECAPDPYGDGGCGFLSGLGVVSVPDCRLLLRHHPYFGIQGLAWSTDETHVGAWGERYQEGIVRCEIEVPPG